MGTEERVEETPPPPLAAPSIATATMRAPLGIKLLRPLSIRDFALLWIGMTASLLGDGIYAVAIAWQVLQISNAATALSLVGVAWTIPQVLLLLPAGVLTDRFDRRRALILADVIRAGSIAAVGALSLAGTLELWHLYVLVAIYGIGEALFMPAFSAIVPTVVPDDHLVEANSLDQFVRPFALRLIGPVVGGAIVAVWEPGHAFLIDSVSFLISALAVLAMTANRIPRDTRRGTMAGEIREGVRFIGSRTWLWAGLLATAIGLLAFYGPWLVLVPIIVKNHLHGGAEHFGLVLAAGGVGAIVASIVVGQRGLPRRPIVVVFVTWSLSTILLAGFSLSEEIWQAMVVAFGLIAFSTAGQIIWTTLQQRFVPRHLIGRVSSVDWLVSSALIPMSLALTGPLAHRFGASPTLVVAGVVGCAAMLSFLLIPSMRVAEPRTSR